MARDDAPERTTHADKVYALLFGQLMNGTFDPGAALNIPTLSREFEVSQTPIREALARLEHTGLVHREALRGYFVAPLFSEVELDKLMEARLVLEPALALEAGRRVTPEFLAKLLVPIDDLLRLSESQVVRSFREYWSADEDFHSLIAEQSANPFLEGAYRSLGGQVQRFRLFVKLGSADARFAAAEHRQIYDAFVARSPEAAADLMRHHIESARLRALSDRKTILANE
ncbi:MULTISPECIES: GntR family transcriptional regulator [unclassified Cryobacterium]|uniref:GntR family transcriptional regulator n=1 Tax=unclassified Cryobacterium TaxID=2649013 RepID=UPI00106C9D96|nr:MULTISPECIES: GntR family transcriptional regulator [unclassified Cryobacterium]TFD07434.1 GntR family transcriptional regulator [Cryobacterium sp. TMT1-66-1]TFD14329.1 GntR family transcriptional regulator [Cryobacterium sp. TMT1-2-2]